MRWDGQLDGLELRLDWGDINQAFAAGKVGMYISGSDVYTNLVAEQRARPDDYGLTAIPLAKSNDAGVLGGGTLAAVDAERDDAEKDAAVKWIDFYYMQKLINEDAAVADAKTLAANKQPVGVPGAADLRQGAVRRRRTPGSSRTSTCRSTR